MTVTEQLGEKGGRMPQRTGRNAESQRSLPQSAAPGSVPDRLREAATELFSEYGFDGTSVQDIVEAAQLTKGALYYYYTSKSDILHEIYHALIRRQLEGLDRVLTLDLEPAETIRTLLTDLLETTAAFRRESVIFRREMHKLEPQHLKSIAADRRRYHDTFLDLIAQGQRDGVFSDKISAEIATYTVFGMINQLCTWYRPDGPKTPQQIADELTDFTLAALRTENSAN